MEGTAEAGEILLSPDDGRRACTVAASANAKGGGFLLKRIPRTEAKDPLAWGEVPDDRPGAVYPRRPARAHRRRRRRRRAPSHRGGFVAFGGVDELLAGEGRRTHSRSARRVHRRLPGDRSTRYDVCFLYADVYGNGGKVFFLVGAPVSHEDNEERVLRAALEISATHHDGLHLHTGLNRGYVFAGDIGAKFRRTYTVLGDAVNTAARVMASCNEDSQVRAMPEVLDLASSRFAAEAQAPFAAKGKALPLTTFAVGEPLGPRLVRHAAAARRTRRGDGRAHGSARRRPKQGAAGSCALSAPPGVGKSRLVDELRARRRRRRFGHGHHIRRALRADTVYFVLRQLMTLMFDGAEEDEETLLEAADELAPTGSGVVPAAGAGRRT